jgi:hypothetical protein
MSIRAILASVLAICAAVLATAQASARTSSPIETERLDRNSARAQAQLLMPVIADEVFDGQRYIMRGIPTGGQLGIVYRFRLRPRPVRYQPLCELQIVNLHYDFAAGQPRFGWSIREVDPLALKRAGTLRPGDLSIQRSFLQLAPAPQSEQEHAARCREADTEPGWQYAADYSEFRHAQYYLDQLNALLSGDHGNVALRCLDPEGNECAASAEAIRETLRRQRSDFREMQLADGRQWIQFGYWDRDGVCLSRSDVSSGSDVIIEERAGQIVSVSLVHRLTFCGSP